MSKIYIGIDIGKNGGIACICRDIAGKEQVSLQATPTTGSTASKEIDKQAIKNYFFVLRAGGYEPVVVMENVHSIFGVGAKANFQFGRALGIIEGILEALEVPYYKIQPKKWQEVCFEGVGRIMKPGKPAEGRGGTDTKAMALVAAQRLYPKLDLRKSERAKVAHNGIVDALLLTHYCKLKY